MCVAAAAAVVAFAVPAQAAQWLVLGQGVAVQQMVGIPNLLMGVPFDQQFVSFAFTIDTDTPYAINPPPGGVGQSRSYTAAVTSFMMQVGSFAVTRTANGAAQLFVLNDVGIPSNPLLRLDQLTLSMGTTYVGGAPVVPLESDAPLPPLTFFSGLTFGRTQSGVVGGLPPMLQSAEAPALDQVWVPGATPPVFMNFDLRAGTPSNPAELQQLALARFNVTQLNFAVFELSTAVPEPATWAMLIAGFGLVGVAARRRRAIA